jgi:hypothetical protein
MATCQCQWLPQPISEQRFTAELEDRQCRLATSDVVAIIHAHALEDVEFLDLTIDVSLARRARPRAPR